MDNRCAQSFRSQTGSRYERAAGDFIIGEGENLEIDPPCRLTVTHDQLREGANDELYGGWPMVLSGLKTLLETGEKLTPPGSLRYVEGREDVAEELPGGSAAAESAV